MAATRTSTSTAAAIGALLTATLFWAGNYVVGGAAVSAIRPLDLVALRWGIAVVPLLALAQLVERPDWRQIARSWHRVLLPALFGLIAYNYLLYTALQYTDAVNASLINAFNPALIAVAAAIFLRQPMTPTAVTGVVVALVGVLWVLCDGHPTAVSSALWNRALTTIPPARAGVFLNLITVFTVLSSVALGKSFTVAEAIGGAVVLGGVAMTNAEAFRGGMARSDARTSR